MKKKVIIVSLVVIIATVLYVGVRLISNLVIENSISNAEETSAKVDTKLLVKAINNYCTISDLKESIDNSVNICKDGISKDDIKNMGHNLDNIKIYDIKFDGSKVTYLKIKSSKVTIEYNNDEYKRVRRIW